MKLLTRLRLLFHRPRPRVRPLPEFMPVIFANGRDDDGPGLKAFWEGKAVLLDDTVIPAGAPWQLRELQLACHAWSIAFTKDGRIVDTVGFLPTNMRQLQHGVLYCEVSTPVERGLFSCSLQMGLRVEP
ncbi:hypothetical protein MRS76_11375 [Rhizobiaceae bacterium n13]|uniref:hypothetical protein n=1 Tax=Ferirhizobium litorale TaxID=2927786 RepID=UPI0024B30EA0|nr:hypothetical protein [Fererhizobium litorale]MDI7862562.1 hypothetical protein [Fererhizobium litorale]